jgi:hypothetical protein
MKLGLHTTSTSWHGGPAALRDGIGSIVERAEIAAYAISVADHVWQSRCLVANSRSPWPGPYPHGVPITDNGQTWSTRDTGTSGFCNCIAIAPNGSLSVVFINDLLQVATITSLDGGETWLPEVILGEHALTNFQLPAISLDGNGQVVIAPLVEDDQQLQLTTEAADGQVTSQINLTKPPSVACADGRLIQPALTAAPSGRAVLQVACKIDPTSELPGRHEVWPYPRPAEGATDPVEVTSFELPVSSTRPTPFARWFPDGGDYWSLTWTDSGVLGMWIDPWTGGGPGTLVSQRVPLREVGAATVVDP